MSQKRPVLRFQNNLDAAQATIAQLERENRLTAEDAALVTYVLTCADAVDMAPGRAILRKEYREALAELRRDRAQRRTAFDSLVADLRSEVGDDASAGTEDARGRGVRGHGATGHAGNGVAANGAGGGARTPG